MPNNYFQGQTNKTVRGTPSYPWATPNGTGVMGSPNGGVISSPAGSQGAGAIQNFPSPAVGIEALPMGKDFLSVIKQMLDNGLPDDVMAAYEKQGYGAINESYKQGKDKLSEYMNMTKGATPVGLGAYGNIELQKGKGMALADLRDKLAMAKQKGKTESFDLYAKMYQLALGQQSQDFNEYAFEEENGFDFFDDILKPLVGAGSMVGAAYAGKT